MQKYAGSIIRDKLCIISFSGIKPFKCGQCDYSTVERSHLKVHIRIHTGTGHYSTAALIRNAKNHLKVHLFTLFSLDIFDMRVEKAAVFFDKIFNLTFLLSFSVIRWNSGIFLVLFNGGVLLLVEWT